MYSYYRDADLVRRIGEATALEVRASGCHYAFAPCVAVSLKSPSDIVYACPKVSVLVNSRRLL